MLQNLRTTVNEHNKLLEMQKSGSLSFESILNSQQRFQLNKPKKWK